MTETGSGGGGLFAGNRKSGVRAVVPRPARRGGHPVATPEARVWAGTAPRRSDRADGWTSRVQL